MSVPFVFVGRVPCAPPLFRINFNCCSRVAFYEMNGYLIRYDAFCGGGQAARPTVLRRDRDQDINETNGESNEAAPNLMKASFEAQAVGRGLDPRRRRHQIIARSQPRYNRNHGGGSEAKPRVLNDSPVDCQTPRCPSPQARPSRPPYKSTV